MKREYPESPIVGVGGIIFANTSVSDIKERVEGISPTQVDRLMSEIRIQLNPFESS